MSDKPWQLIIEADRSFVGNLSGVSTILDHIQPHHTELIVKMPLFFFGRAAVEALLVGLQALARAGDGQRCRLRHLEFVAHDVRGTLEDRIDGGGESAWVAPLVISALLDDADNFLDLRKLRIGTYWGVHNQSDLLKMIFDPRLDTVDLVGSSCSPDFFLGILRWITERIHQLPCTLDRVFLPSPGEDLDAEWYQEFDVQLQHLLATDRAGLEHLYWFRGHYFDLSDQLWEVLKANRWLITLDIAIEFLIAPSRSDVWIAKARSNRILRVNCQRRNLTWAVASSLVPRARVLLFAKQPDPSAAMSLASLPTEVKINIIHHLADVVYEAAEGFVLLSKRQLHNLVEYASNLKTLSRERGRGWRHRVTKEIDCHRWDGE